MGVQWAATDATHCSEGKQSKDVQWAFQTL